jgi:hypothetical protein
MIPAAAIALFSLVGCNEEGYEEGSDTTIIEQDDDPDVTIEEDDGFQAEIDVDDDGKVEGEVKVED